MPSDYHDLVELLEEFSHPQFWKERNEHFARRKEHLASANYYHGPMRRDEEFKRQEAEGRAFPFVRPRRTECNLPIAEAERLERQEISRANDFKRRIDNIDRRIAHMLILLKHVTSVEWGKLSELHALHFETIEKVDTVRMANRIRGVLGRVLVNSKSEQQSESAQPADGISQFDSSGEYFADLRRNQGMKDAAIRDHWQTMSQEQREAICPTDWQLLKSKVENSDKAPSRRCLADNVRRRRKYAEEKLTSSIDKKK
jgi:hypothetical protein